MRAFSSASLREFIRIRIGAGIDIADVANAAGTELGHHELATARLSIVGVRHNIPAQDRGERLELSIGLTLETPLDRALVDVVEAGKRLCIRDISQGKQWLPTRLVDDPRGREGKDVIATLTPRERQITLLVCDGLSTRSISSSAIENLLSTIPLLGTS